MRPVHFEIHAADQQRCAKFYEAVFGWKVTKMQMPNFEYWLVTTGAEGTPGIDGGIVKRMGDNPDPKDPTPVTGYVCTTEVEDIDAVIAKIDAAGGTEALPKGKVDGVGILAYYKDTEGNIFGILQPETPTKK